ncbi:MAG: hypothetical protein ACI9SY_000743 [Candidatus Paceibacteria bacterium]|jgi:hypothetical protein
MNTDMKPTPDNQQTSKSIQDRVFSKITEENVCPRSKYVFWCQNTSVWIIWLVTVLLGALATSVLIFASSYNYYNIYEAMHDNFVTYFIQALPIVWILAFILLMLLAVRGLRATRRGYRFSPLLVGGSSVGMSLFLGIVASTLGFGYLVDKTLGEYAPMYYSMAEREQKKWLQPGEGRLVGQAKVQHLPESGQIIFVDVSGAEWIMNIAELRAFDKQQLNSMQRVRVLGMQTARESGFHACGVFPWMMDVKHPMKEMSHERQVSIERLYKHTDSAEERIENLEQQAFGSASASNTPSMKICAEIAAVRRISEQMQ